MCYTHNKTTNRRQALTTRENMLLIGLYNLKLRRHYPYLDRNKPFCNCDSNHIYVLNTNAHGRSTGVTKSFNVSFVCWQFLFDIWLQNYYVIVLSYNMLNHIIWGALSEYAIKKVKLALLKRSCCIAADKGDN